MLSFKVKAIGWEPLLALIYLPVVLWVFFSAKVVLRQKNITVPQLIRIDSYQDVLIVIIVSAFAFLVIPYFRRRLHEREQFLTSLVDSQSNFLIRLSIDGRFIYVNRSFQRRFNNVTKNFIGSHFNERDWKESEKGLNAFQECIQNPTKIITIITEIEKESPAKHCYIQWEMKAILDQKGTPVQIQGVGLDITEIKLQSEKISKQNKHLKEIAFLSAHIVRSPLANILGLAAILDRNDTISAFNLEVIDNLEISAKQLDKVITDITLKSQEVRNEEL